MAAVDHSLTALSRLRESAVNEVRVKWLATPTAGSHNETLPGRPLRQSCRALQNRTLISAPPPQTGRPSREREDVADSAVANAKTADGATSPGTGR